MNLVNVTLEKRDNISKATLKKARKEGKVPGVIYGGEENIHFLAEAGTFKQLVYTPELRVANVSIDGKTLRCLVKDVQFHPVTDSIQHIDLLQLVDGKKLKVTIPVHFTGNSPGVLAGGTLTRTMRRVKAVVTPESFVDKLTVDISHLEMGHSARVREIKAVEGVEIMTAPASPVATVVVPRSMRSAATAEAKASKITGDEEGEAEAAEATAE